MLAQFMQDMLIWWLTGPELHIAGAHEERIAISDLCELLGLRALQDEEFRLEKPPVSNGRQTSDAHQRPSQRRVR